ncbi:hypothetical protein BABINDRAFT_160342 [Babjeviella inositovora NRRL Y-12698]|uniref:Uncharacterized protein n=1 Tax=Babjeviella inositovora NRRL Y-12698 TaxID=984486 RepID=A0A1E3QTM4_9ASCO|nr:uncharacterized protein BABINDRAFT_160342 [Babjeviella inositovora NRRL Y-12698]ODQ80894.1 hypothetical protein BABINDRAFT_160342 [Babjeviella inositovora NRRL Y-12698]
MSYGWSASAGFDFGFGSGSSLSMGVTITKSNTQGGLEEYVIPAHGVGQVWQHQLMVWQDQQTQDCVKKHYGSGGLKCGPWSGYIHADIPVDGGSVHSWSSGYNNVDTSRCG